MKVQTKKALSFLSRRRPLAELDVPHDRYVFLLMDYIKNKGEEALQALAGFYCYAIDNLGEKSDEAIRSTFTHDLFEQEDEWMLPRSSSYLGFWEKELKERHQDVC